MADKIKVLIVDDNDETRDGTQRLLEYEDNIEILGFAENGMVAIEQVKELNPDVVLMDINMPVMDGLTATQRLQREAPRARVIIVSVQDDAHYLKEAFRAGAVDFVSKPITSSELAQAIERAYEKAPPTPAPAPSRERAPERPSSDGSAPRIQGSIISVVGPKGGVGKTTVAVNLAVGLARSAPNKKIVVVDGNLFFGDVGVFLNTRGQYSVIDLVLMAEEPEQMDMQAIESVLVSHESGIKLLVAPPNPADIPRMRPESMVNLLKILKGYFDYIVLDTATGYDDMLSAAIQSADKLLALTTPTMPALKDMRILFSELTAVEFLMSNVLLILNKVEKTGRITPEQITNFLKHGVDAQIPMDPQATEAVNRGIPLVDIDNRRAPGGRAIMEITRAVRESVERIEAVEDEATVEGQKRGGLLGGLLGGTN
ncbi:MAG: response regulator [Chloroflexota bacterium]|jgi:pilus assembly protein CpaE